MAFDHRRITYVFAAFSFLSIGVIQLYAGQVLIGRPPLPLGGWSGTWLAWIVGVLLIMCGVLAIMRKSAIILFSALTAAFVILYCVLPNLWLVFNGDVGIALTGFGKGLSLVTGLLVLSAATPSQRQTGRNKMIMRICNYALGFFLLTSGIQHFLFASFVVTLIPTWIPFSEFWAYAGGVFLVISGLCVITRLQLRIV
ncbi:MAG TPA: hypothetical protein VD884_11320 [Ohtaekwangia sp.]|nr:hypothetical protein [Ohtaekwangia sp.]